MRKQLTEAMALRLTPPATGRLEIFDAIVPGLALRLTANGARSFVVRGRIKGQAAPLRLTLGDARIIKVSEARRLASDALRAMRSGIDPRGVKESALTFDELIAEWSALHLSQRRPRYAAEAPRAVRSALANLLKRPAAGITRGEAVNAIDKVALAGKTVHARNVLAYACACFGWAAKRGKVPTNPFANLPREGGKSERDRVLSDDEMAVIWAAAGKLSYPFGPFYKLAILTLQRREEVAAMRWSEIAPDLSRWTIPGERMKNGRPHDVHLSEPARDMLRTLPRLDGCDFVFSTGRRRTQGANTPAPVSGFSQAKRYLDAEIAKVIEETGATPPAPWTPHDFRRTGVTKLAALGFDSIVADKLLAHQPTKLRGVAGIYQRHDFARERAAALDAWAAFVTRQKKAAQVVDLSGRWRKSR